MRCWEISSKEERLDSPSHGAEHFIVKTNSKQTINETTSNGDQCAMRKMKQRDLIELLQAGRTEDITNYYEGISWKESFDLRSERQEGTSYVKMALGVISKDKCKGPEAEMSLTCLENGKKAWEAAVPWQREEW